MEIKKTFKYIVNGKEYGSLEEVPAELRGLVQGASKLKSGFHVNLNFSFNGKEYKSPEEMPEGVRKIFEDKNKNGVPDILENGRAVKAVLPVGEFNVVSTDSPGKLVWVGLVIVILGLTAYWLTR